MVPQKERSATGIVKSQAIINVKAIIGNDVLNADDEKQSG